MSTGPQKHEKAQKPEDWKKVGLAVISTEESGRFSLSTCNCGWTSRICTREKVREDRVDRHIDRRHNGRGVRL